MKLSGNKILITGGADLGGKGLHDSAPPVNDFIESIFSQLENGSNEVSFAASEARVKANNATIAEYFSKLNPI